MRPESSDIVSVAVDVKGEKQLRKINIKQPLHSIIEEIVGENELMGDVDDYGLLLTHVKTQETVKKYVTELNRYKTMLDGCEYKLVESPEKLLRSIFEAIYRKENRQEGLERLHAQLYDEIIIKYIYESGYYEAIFALVIKETLSDIEATACLHAVFKLIKFKYIQNIERVLVKQIIKKLFTKNTDVSYVAVLCLIQILKMKHSAQFYDMITGKVDIKSILLPLLASATQANFPELQLSVIMLMNTFVKVTNDPRQRYGIIMVMNENRHHIYNDIIEKISSQSFTLSKLKYQFEKELSIYQGYVLSLYADKLETKINLMDASNFQLSYLNEEPKIINSNDASKIRAISVVDYELSDKNKFYLGQDFPESPKLIDDSDFFYKMPSILNLNEATNYEIKKDLRTSNSPGTPKSSGHLQNVASKISFFETHSSSSSTSSTSSKLPPSKHQSYPKNNKPKAVKLTRSDAVQSVTDKTLRETYRQNGILISELTLECLVYFKSRFPQSFTTALIEGNSYEPGFYVTSEKIINIMNNELHINQPPPLESTSYCPLAFQARLNEPFIQELFCRFIWLLVRTRGEMHARNFLDDQLKVMEVVEKKINIIISSKPLTFHDLTRSMKDLSYSRISYIWQKERNLKWRQLLYKTPSVIELASIVEPDILTLLENQRMNYLFQGHTLYKIDKEKKGKSNHIFMQLLLNRQQFKISDWNSDLETCAFDYNLISVSDIKYLLIGNACSHVKEHHVKSPKLAFSFLKDDMVEYCFEAENEKSFDYWIDGVNLLLKKPISSNSYEREKKQLMEIELTLRLLDVEDISLPSGSPPEVPPPPASYNFNFQ